MTADSGRVTELTGTVAAATSAGSKVLQADAHDFLVTHPREFDGVFCSHLIEHLTPPDAKRLIDGIAGALNQDGVLCLVTPNPGSLPTTTHEFWRDPSHARPYDLEALEFLCLSAGLEIVESGQNPDSERGLPIDPDDLEFAETVREGAPPDERQPRIAGAVAAQFEKSRMARDLKAVIHEQRTRIEDLERHVRLLSDSLRRLLDVLYEPSEIFVVARKA